MHWSYKRNIMKTLTIRNVPDDVYQSLSDLAKQQHRSMQEQLRMILQRESEVVHGKVCEEAAQYRVRFQNRPSARSVVEDIREDRER
jgi:plasmid stability protein